MGGKTNRHPGPKPSRWTYSSRTAMEYVPGQRKHEWFTNVVDIQISSSLPYHKTIWKKPPQQLTKVVYYLPRHVHILDATFWTFHGWGSPSLRYGCDPKEHDSIPWLKVFQCWSFFSMIPNNNFIGCPPCTFMKFPIWPGGWMDFSCNSAWKTLETIRGGEFSLLQLQSVEVRLGICFKRTGSTTHYNRICNSYRFQPVNQSGINRIGHSFLWGGTRPRAVSHPTNKNSPHTNGTAAHPTTQDRCCSYANHLDTFFVSPQWHSDIHTLLVYCAHLAWTLMSNVVARLWSIEVKNTVLILYAWNFPEISENRRNRTRQRTRCERDTTQQHWSRKARHSAQYMHRINLYTCSIHCVSSIPPLKLGSVYLLRVGVLEMTISLLQPIGTEHIIAQFPIHDRWELMTLKHACQCDSSTAPWVKLMNYYLPRYEFPKAQRIWHAFCAVARESLVTQ